MYIKRNIKFLLHKRVKGQVERLSVRMRFTLPGERPLDIPTGHHVDLADWDETAMRAKESCPEGREINRMINEWISVMEEIIARYELIEKRLPTTCEVKDLFNDMTGRRKTSVTSKLPDETRDLWQAFDEFMSEMGKRNQWTPVTYQKFNSIRNHLKAFEPRLSFPAINDERMQAFLDFLRRKEMRNTTIENRVAFVRWFLRWAHAKGYYTGMSHETFRPKLKGVDGNAKEIIYLSLDELNKLREHPLAPTQASLERVRDVFLFCCFTGLRYSDAAKLRRSDIKGDHIEVVTKKTNDGLRIELNKHSKAILDKYKGEDIKGGLALPVISNQKMNATLKILGQACGLDEPTRVVYFVGNERHEEVYPKWALLTTHCARRTFVVTALQLGIPAEVIMKWTGHSGFEAMKPYVKIVDELKARSMTRFDSL